MRSSARGSLVALFVLAAVLALAVGLSVLAVSPDSNGGEPSAPSNGTVEDEIAELHAAGVTGENVTVGVLDVTGYDLDHENYDQQIVQARQFGNDSTYVGAGDVHGTATAATVARVAPDADLYLASFDDAEGYESAVTWMVEQDVDVVVTPVSQAGSLGDGTTRLSRVTTSAVNDGVVVVAPTGNIAGGHWLGEYRPTDEGVHRFNGETLNTLGGRGSRAEFWLAWDAPAENYTLELHEVQDEQTELIARSVRYSSERVASERLTARLEPDEEYALAVRGPEEPTGTTLRVATPTHTLAAGQKEQSLTAPAAAPGAISVGAVDPVTGEAEPFSSRGPTRDGRLGVNVVAPSSQSVPGIEQTFTGTSASASVVGGVTALMLDVNPEMDPRTVRLTLGTTAGGGQTASPTTGHGIIDPFEAVAESSASFPTNETG